MGGMRTADGRLFYEPMPGREEFDEALQHAQAIYDFVVKLLPAEARP